MPILSPSENPPIVPEFVQSLTNLSQDWWVAHTRSRQEKALAWDLVRKGVPYFLPLIEEQRVICGKRRRGMRVLFPGYVFFNGNADTRYEVFTTDRICQVIPVNDQSEIQGELLGIFEALHSRQVVEWHPHVHEGCKVRIRRGPMKGVTGVVLQSERWHRIALNVSLIGQSITIEVHGDDLDPA
jgi:transcriptional antiterminator NusG